MSYAIMRMQKVKLKSLTGAYLHNERQREKYGNENIDTSKSDLNYHLKQPQGSYLQDVQQKIDDRYNNKRKIRTDANVSVEMLFTSDNVFFDNLTEKEQQEYFNLCYEFLQEFVGEENIVSAVVHLDEETPHLHAVFTPITRDGRLSTKDYVNGRKDMRRLQDLFYAKVSERFPHLERGIPVEVSKAKHKTIERLKMDTDFYNKNKKEIKQVLKDLEQSKKQVLGMTVIKEEKLQKLEEIFEQSLEILDTEKNKLEELQNLEDKISEKTDLYNASLIQVTEVQEELEKLEKSKKKREASFKQKLEDKYKSLIEENLKLGKYKTELQKEVANYSKIKADISLLKHEVNRLIEKKQRIASEIKIQGNISKLQKEQQELEAKLEFEKANYNDILSEGLKQVQKDFFNISDTKLPQIKPKIDITDLNVLKELIYCREIVKNLGEDNIHWSTKKLAQERTAKILINSLGMEKGKDRSRD